MKWLASLFADPRDAEFREVIYSARQAFAEAETVEMDVIPSKEDETRVRAYYLAEADGFRRSPEHYWWLASRE